MIPGSAITEAPRLRSQRLERPFSAVIVDASSYSLPYDSSLANALSQLGCLVSLARSEFLHSPWGISNTFNEWIGFYRASCGLAKRFGITPWLKYAKGIEHPFSMRGFLRRVRDTRPDVIHFQWLPLPMIDQWFLRSLASQFPLVLTLHNTGKLFHGNVSRWREFGSKDVFRVFDAVIVHSEFSRRQVLQQGIVSEERLHIIPHGTLDYYCTLVEESATSPPPSGLQEILFFGQIHAYKGLDVLIEAFARLPEAIRDGVLLRVAGNPGMDLGSLRKRARELGIAERIVWQLGFLREDEIPGLFRRASVAALPYRAIDQSGVMMTALAFNLPVVASRVGGFGEVIQGGVHGHLIEPNDVEALTRALAGILSSPERQLSMRQAIQTLRTGDLSWSSVAGKTLSLYRSLAGGRIGVSGTHSKAA
jgi:glycosyltransferase involved in cell wall biosynthesis